MAALAPGPERRRLNNAYRWSKGAGSQAHWFFERCFPLTPSLPEERENRTPRFQPSGAPRLVAARDALFPLPAGEGQGEGEGGLQLSATRRLAWRGALFSLAQNSQLHRQFASALVCGAFLPPHPGPLPEERENRTPRFQPSGAPRLVAARDALFPLPAGDVANQPGGHAIARPPRMWQCRWGTDSPACGPLLITRR